MRRLVLAALGLAAGAFAVHLAGAGCSCPPGYHGQPIAAGTWELVDDGTDGGVDGGADGGTPADTNYRLVVAVDQKSITETFERNGVKYENVYRVTGTSP